MEPPTLTVEQYRQLHEMRREYIRFIFQAPTIVVAIVVGTLAVLFKGNSALDFNGSPTIAGAFAGVVLLPVGGFVLVIGYWAFRSRWLLTTHRDLAEGDGNVTRAS